MKSKALVPDRNVMPRQTCEHLQLDPGSTYSDGAIVVAAEHSRFIDVLRRSF
jgi:hypothetical protein